MTTFSPIILTCSVCGKSFKSNEIGSCGFASKRTDFRPNYWGFNPVEYFFHLCPCGFCGPKQIFELKIEIDDVKNEIFILGPLEEHTLPQKLERACQSLEILNKYGIVESTEYELAESWLNTFWWAMNSEEEKQFGEIVLKYYEIAFNKGQIPSDHFYGLLYLMGEINRRIVYIDKANKYFDEVISLTNDRDNLKDIRNLAIQQKEEPKENF
jgi:uncharacterized protein (DUF2225 family)